MKRSLFSVITLLTLVMVAGCGDDKEDKRIAFVPQNARPGWTVDKVDSLIACHGTDDNTEAFCKCTITAIATRYTPEEVEQAYADVKKGNKTAVSQDIVNIGKSCQASLSGSGQKTEPSEPGIGGAPPAYSYNLTENGCSTGVQSFPSVAYMCEGLQSETLNHGCAQSLRRSMFSQEGCAGTFTPHN